MVIPEFSLFIGAFGGFCGFLSIGVDPDQRVVAKDEFDFVGFDILIVKFGIGVIFKLFAEGALEVAEFDDSYFGIRVTKRRQVALCNINFCRRKSGFFRLGGFESGGFCIGLGWGGSVCGFVI